MWDSSSLRGPGILPTLLLTTTGRKSGQQKVSPLIYKKVGDGYVIIASKGGAPTHPAWYLNPQVDAGCEIQVGSVDLAVTARDAIGDERQALWDQLAEVYPPYNAYQQTAGDRGIPVVVLESR
jgi:deazaflavin-dependent oxidoreductase (nitroreductase family)